VGARGEAVTDTITLPRVDAEQIRASLASGKRLYAALTALDAALAQPDAKREPVAWMYVNSEGECEQIEYETPPAGDDSITPLYAAPPEPDAIARAVEAEREACAKVCEEVGNRDSDNHAWDAAYVIRARGSK